MNEIIEKLKKNEKPFGLLEPEEQECFNKVGKKNCIYISTTFRGWSMCCITSKFAFGCTYAIKPDYQPGPEFVDLEIVESKGWLGLYFPPNFKVGGKENLNAQIGFKEIHCLPSLPNFEGFICKPKGLIHEEKWFLQGVAKQIAQGKTIFARFRTKE